MISAIQTSDLTRHFREVKAVDHIALQVPQGSIFGFLGPNGAGKTTTIRLLLRLIRADKGTIRILDLEMPKNRQLILQKIGALVELPSLYPHLTGYENLDITRRILGRDRQQIANVLKIVGMEKEARRLVRAYSLGMRQRLGLALALLGDPELLILDEPMNGLDPAGIKEMRALIKHLAYDRGITIFLSSHLLSEVEQIATHVGIVANGTLIFQGTLDSLRTGQAPYIRIEIDRPASAAQVLSARGYTVMSSQGSTLHISSESEMSTARITSLLIENQIAVSHISRVVPSLEELFTNLTAGGK